MTELRRQYARYNSNVVQFLYPRQFREMFACPTDSEMSAIVLRVLNVYTIEISFKISKQERGSKKRANYPHFLDMLRTRAALADGIP